MINLNGLDFSQEAMEFVKTIKTKTTSGHDCMLGYEKISITKITLNQSIRLFPNFLYREGKAKSTSDAYMYDMKFFNGFIRTNFPNLRYVHQINYRIIKEYKDFLLKKYNTEELAKNTMDRRFNALKTFFKFLSKQKYIAENILDGDKFGNKKDNIKRLPSCLNQHEINRILDSIKKYNGTNKYRDIAMFELMINYGCRQSEVRNLKWESADFYENTITIQRSKTNNADTLPMNYRVKNALLDYLNTLGKSINIYVFISQKGNPLSKGAFEQMFNKYIKLSGLQKEKRFRITPHTLRHSFITTLIQEGTPLPIIQKYTGHKDVGSLEIYTHLNTANLQKVVNLFDKFKE